MAEFCRHVATPITGPLPRLRRCGGWGLKSNSATALKPTLSILPRDSGPQGRLSGGAVAQAVPPFHFPKHTFRFPMLGILGLSFAFGDGAAPRPKTRRQRQLTDPYQSRPAACHLFSPICAVAHEGILLPPWAGGGGYFFFSIPCAIKSVLRSCRPCHSHDVSLLITNPFLACGCARWDPQRMVVNLHIRCVWRWLAGSVGICNCRSAMFSRCSPYSGATPSTCFRWLSTGTLPLGD